MCSDCANLLALIYVVYFITINKDFSLDYPLLISVFQLQTFFENLLLIILYIFTWDECAQGDLSSFFAEHAKGAKTHTYRIYVCVFCASFVRPRLRAHFKSG